MQKLFLDFDGTITDSIKAYCNVYNKTYNEKTGYKRADYNLVERYDLKDECGLVNHQEEIFSTKNYFQELEFFPGAYEVLQRLNTKYDLIICSIGTLTNISNKSLWIKSKLPFIDNTILISTKLLPGGIKTDKSSINMRGGIFIDDHQENLFTSDADYKICFGRKYDWNSKWLGDRCLTWEQIENKL
ncbi:MAG: HAD hydrolase-like protein [Bacillota bacterium]|nr:HAD hydrolase-like protein [Bacillota bacterium]